MAQAMTSSGQSSVLKPRLAPEIGSPIPPISIADVAFTTTLAAGAVQSLAYACTNFQVQIYLKTLVLGANTGALQGPAFYLLGADDVGMTTNLTVIGGIVLAVNIASATNVQSLRIQGITPVAAKQFVRIVVDPTPMGAGSSGTYDAYIMCEP